MEGSTPVSNRTDRPSLPHRVVAAAGVDLGVLRRVDFDPQRVEPGRGLLRREGDVVLGAHLLLDAGEGGLHLLGRLGDEQTSTGFLGQALQNGVTGGPQASLVHGEGVDLDLASLRGRDDIGQRAQAVGIVAVGQDHDRAMHRNAIVVG